MISTSINMHLTTLAALTHASRRLQTSRRDLIVRLLMCVMRDVNTYRQEFRTVAYQPDNPGNKWHCFPIRFKPDENEFFTDLRNICKCSVSFLVAIAVIKYLDELLDEIGKDANNNMLYCNYCIKRDDIEGITVWTIYWGIPIKRKNKTPT